MNQPNFAASSPETIALMIKQLRPKQWSKNALVFAALIFSVSAASTRTLVLSLCGFILFALVSSAVYILNDYIDREADRHHPTKRFRPMASGALNPSLAISVGTALVIGGIIGGLLLSVPFGLVLTLYFAINLLYALRLKHVVLIDIMCIASGFVLRAIGGGLAIEGHLTPWFLVCTMLLSLFLAISKRRQELTQSQTNGSARKVLRSYTKELLDQMNMIVAATTIMSYALFTFTSGRTTQLMWTIPFVLYGLFRYLYLIHVEGKGESPDKLLFEDKHLLVCVALYALTVVFILMFFE